jgi:hypothetical protein
VGVAEHKLAQATATSGRLRDTGNRLHAQVQSLRAEVQRRQKSQQQASWVLALMQVKVAIMLFARRLEPLMLV